MLKVIQNKGVQSRIVDAKANETDLGIPLGKYVYMHSLPRGTVRTSYVPILLTVPPKFGGHVRAENWRGVKLSDFVTKRTPPTPPGATFTE